MELEAVEDRFKNLGWERAYGASGTILAVHTVIRENGWGQAITKKGLKKVSKALVEAGKVGKLSLPGLTPERAPVFAGGVAILRSVFDGLDVDVLERSNGALREGVLYDLIGRNRHEDTRERTIQRLVEQYRIDTAQADRVERTALLALKQLKKAWNLEDPELRHLITWAAQLHEIGITISYSGYQRHGAYIVANGELPGFSRDDQALLAALISAHRRKLNRIAFQDLMVDEETALRLAILIRVAVLLNRHRSPRALPPVAAAGAKKSLSMTPTFPGRLARRAPADPRRPGGGSESVKEGGLRPRRELSSTSHGVVQSRTWEDDSALSVTDRFEARDEVALAQCLLEQPQRPVDAVRIQLLPKNPPKVSCVLDILGASRQHFGNYQILGIDYRYRRVSELHDPRAFDKVVLEARSSKHNVQRHSCCEVHERHHSGAANEVGVVDAEGKTS